MTAPLDDDIEPLEPDLWFAALEQLSQRQAKADGTGVESLLRHAFHLVQLTPSPLKNIVQCPLDERSFEDLLKHQAFDSAAIALVGPPAGLEVHCPAGTQQRMFLATVRLPGQSEAIAGAHSQSAASALVGAWSNCLLALRQPWSGNPPPRRARHRPPVESHPKSIGH